MPNRGYAIENPRNIWYSNGKCRQVFKVVKEMDDKTLAGLLFPQSLPTPEELEARYPSRKLPEGAVVTRFAPSPTGFVHFGSLFPVMTGLCLARRSGGVFYLRIEDTDQKRGARLRENIIESRGFTGSSSTRARRSAGSRRLRPYRQRERAGLPGLRQKAGGEGKATLLCTEKTFEMRTRQSWRRQLRQLLRVGQMPRGIWRKSLPGSGGRAFCAAPLAAAGIRAKGRLRRSDQGKAGNAENDLDMCC